MNRSVIQPGQGTDYGSSILSIDTMSCCDFFTETLLKCTEIIITTPKLFWKIPNSNFQQNKSKGTELTDDNWISILSFEHTPKLLISHMLLLQNLIYHVQWSTLTGINFYHHNVQILESLNIRKGVENTDLLLIHRHKDIIFIEDIYMASPCSYSSVSSLCRSEKKKWQLFGFVPSS